MKKTNIVNLTVSFVIAVEVAVIAGLAFDRVQGSANRDLAIRIKKQSLETFSTQPGNLYESVGGTDGGCTITYHGDGVATSAAHCFDGPAAGVVFKRYVKFHCDEKIEEGWDCSQMTAYTHPTAMITEVAIPRHYRPVEDGIATKEFQGYDIAFVRMVPVAGAELPKANFPLSDKIETLNVSNAGYNAGSLGLTGEASCKITHPNLLPSNDYPYAIQTDCYAVPGSSGGPLMDEHHRVIGVHSSGSFLAGGNVNLSTPITPGLKAAFEQFRAGTLEGDTTTHEHWRGPYKITRFSYERTPVEIHPDPCC